MDSLVSGTTTAIAAPVFLSEQERAFLRHAAAYLEQPSFLMRIANLAGKPAEAVLGVLPTRVQSLIHETTQHALRNSLNWAIRSLPESRSPEQALILPDDAEPRFRRHLHTMAAAGTGAVGGLFGLTGVAIEIPATTTIMLRSIARIAAQSGANLHDPMTRLHCLSVLSMGAPSLDAMESAYFTGRFGLAMYLRDVGALVARQTSQELIDLLTHGTSPLLVKLLNKIASKFQIVVSQKVAAQAAPIAGAAFGALINAAFTDHFNTVARYHFGILSMERLRGAEAVQAAYAQACSEQSLASKSSRVS